MSHYDIHVGDVIKYPEMVMARTVYDSVSCLMRDNENQFYKNDLPAEGTSCPVYI